MKRFPHIAALTLALLFVVPLPTFWSPIHPQGTGVRFSTSGTVFAQVSSRRNEAPRYNSSGGFSVEYHRPRNQRYLEMYEYMGASIRYYEDIATNLNRFVALPTNVPIIFKECEQVNAFYSPQTRSISICYEYMEGIFNVFVETVKDRRDAEGAAYAITDSIAFVLFHEIGHALTHVLQLPVTGREEDAVDQLSFVVLVIGMGGGGGERSVLNGAHWFSLIARKNPRSTPFYDEHSLDEQRYYNLLCWVYGRNPRGYAALVQNGTLPQQRAVRCGNEYAQLTNSWMRLLSPYIRR